MLIDSNRVKVETGGPDYFEFDTWYGAKFNRDIRTIKDSIVKLKHPTEFDAVAINFHAGGVNSVDILWNTDKNLKIFQLHEFLIEDHKIFLESIVYHPVKYIHAVFDITKKCFVHFDGAIHFHTPQEYKERLDSNLDHNYKNKNQIKPFSKKLFKLDGKIPLNVWENLTTHYLYNDLLIKEYFEGKPPSIVDKLLRIFRAKDGPSNFSA